MEDDNARREREMRSTLEQIKTFHKKTKKKWHLDVPLWKLAIEGSFTFLAAFLVGLGIAVLYRTIIN